MANEITAKCSMRYVEGSVDVQFPVDGVGVFNVDVTGTDYHHGTMTVSAVAAALEKGSVSTPGVMIVKNHSATADEIVRLKTATAGVVFAKIGAGEMAMFQWDENLTAPFVLSDTGTPQIEYLLVEA